jgi:hypothetical protein
VRALSSEEGSVKDASGAVVSGATVTLTNTDEGAVRTTKSNGVGDYRFLDVKAGHYSVEVAAPGFEKWASPVWCSKSARNCAGREAGSGRRAAGGSGHRRHGERD